jgi:prephenate dehydrogenase
MYPQATIYGIDTNEIHLQAIALGVIDAAGSMIDYTADFVIVSVPVDGALVVFATSTRFDW